MYIILILLCLSGDSQCIQVQEDPVKYYFTEKNCQKELTTSLNNLVDAFKEEKSLVQMQGQCVYIGGIKQT